jgi:hypothetical protein
LILNRDSRAGDQEVDSSKLVFGHSGQLRNLVGIANIAADGNGRASRLLDGIHQIVEAVKSQARQDHLSSQPGERKRRRSSNT